MARRQSRTDIASGAIIALTALAGVAVWSRLPAEVAIHFSASGTPDNYVSKPVGVVLMPALMLATLIVLKLAFRYDPPDVPRVAATITVATMAFMSGIHGLVLAWNLGYSVPFDIVLVGSLVWTVVMVAYALKAEYVD
ncbi:hypothetical protein HISP_13870 [Haloarcula hispanica N601]|uniref:DUF1648 domain-containing protein n=3 Tax=Haloarcula hispanica TaxID=51589 RepID=V5TQ13_HALHI|nr:MULTISPECIES: DUF1648 domain-containing protein [Haloarcula]AEM58313.1 conserved hypothetical protein [Haloarcula hispanica ATCC 33960]AHB67047.1 hypothetical protein HISP_13870 [Haloarcula hispanica N601]AJF25343.1 hypothetical protein SG26_06150 [Haloarcula sp. CBA1115]KAA9406035.1 DUF1648 domain-containing protein [Haloarcula sp. CBA1131]KZX47167.1 hypothetical protein AV929_02245 [Haloarcula sp. K1]